MSYAIQIAIPRPFPFCNGRFQSGLSAARPSTRTKLDDFISKFNEVLAYPVTFSYNGLPSAVDAGSYDVVASFAGNQYYSPASATAEANPTATMSSWRRWIRW